MAIFYDEEKHICVPQLTFECLEETSDLKVNYESDYGKELDKQDSHGQRFVTQRQK